jgi:hypothetical protein
VNLTALYTGFGRASMADASAAGVLAPELIIMGLDVRSIVNLFEHCSARYPGMVGFGPI